LNPTDPRGQNKPARRAGFFQHGQGQPVGITTLVDHPFNPGVGHHFGTEYAGLVRDVKGASGNGNTMYSGLQDGVLFGVQTAA